MKKILTVAIIAMFAILAVGAVYAAQEPAKQQAPKAAPVVRPMPPMMDKSIVFLNGSISKVDVTDPNAVKVEIMNDADKKTHIVEIGPMTNIAKVIEASQLQAGEKVRGVARTVDNKEVALNLITGNIKEPPRPASTMTAQPAVAQPLAARPAAPVQEKAKK